MPENSDAKTIFYVNDRHPVYNIYVIYDIYNIYMYYQFMLYINNLFFNIL